MPALKIIAVLVLFFSGSVFANEEKPPVIGYFEEVIGEVVIRDDQESRSAMTGELIYGDERVIVKEGGLALVILTADGFRSIDIPESKGWSWQDYERSSDDAISLVVSKSSRPGGVMRSGDATLSWSLPRETSLAVMPLKLDWRTDDELIARATVTLRDQAGDVLERFEANGASGFPRAYVIRADTPYHWTVELEDATTYAGSFTLLTDDELARIQERYYAIPAHIADDESQVLQYKALVLMENELYLEAGKLLKDYAVKNPDDAVAREWLIMLSNIMAQ